MEHEGKEKEDTERVHESQEKSGSRAAEEEKEYLEGIP